MQPLVVSDHNHGNVLGTLGGKDAVKQMPANGSTRVSAEWRAEPKKATRCRGPE